MKTALLLIVALPLVAAPGPPALALGFDCPSISASCCDPPARWAPRHDTRDSRLAITTQLGDATLLLTDRVVAVQLSDRTLHKMKRGMRKEQISDEDNVIANAIKTAVVGAVEVFIDRSAECSIRDVKDVSYRDGRLVFTTEKDGEIYDRIDVNDEEVMRSFSERDARAFVREFRKVKARTR